MEATISDIQQQTEALATQSEWSEEDRRRMLANQKWLVLQLGLLLQFLADVEALLGSELPMVQATFPPKLVLLQIER